MSAYKSLAIGSSLGWLSTAVSMAAAGLANIGTLAAGALPAGLWTIALLTESVKEEKERRQASAPVED